MSACCIFGCKNRHSTTSKLKFYRIPSGPGPFQKHRRRLWLQAINNACSNSEEPKGNARVCGAHFISGQASMNHDSPDFVPSVFPCTKKSPDPKKKVEMLSQPKRRRGRPRKVNVASDRRTPPPSDTHPQVLQSSSPVETAPSEPSEATSSSPTDAMEGETLTQELNETHSKTENPQTSSRSLFLQAMETANSNSKEPKGQASVNHDSPDFVPCVFPCTKKSPDPKKEAETLSQPKRRRGRPRKVNVATDRRTPPASDTHPQVLQSSSPVETAPSEPSEATSSSPTDAMEGETQTQEQNETQTKTENSQTSSSSLLLQAMENANSNGEEPKGNARVCGAHFISGQASMNHDSPDFVPSVFPCTKKSPDPKKEVEKLSQPKRRRGRPRKVNVASDRRTPPASDTHPQVLQSSSPVETAPSEPSEATSSSPTDAMEGETLTQELDETQTKTENPQTSTSPSKASPSSELADNPKIEKGPPFVPLRSVITSFGWYQCEVCSSNFTSVAKFIKHQEQHDKKRPFCCEICGKRFRSSSHLAEHHLTHTGDRPFPCNMCEKSFSTSHILKRHKLLHVQDRRKCGICGTLFCRRHNHILFQTQAESIYESEPEPEPEPEPESASESESQSESEPEPEPEPEPNAYITVSNMQRRPDVRQSAEVTDSNESTIVTPTAQTVSPTPPHHQPQANKDMHTASHPDIILLLPVDLSLPPQPSTLPCPPPPSSPEIPTKPKPKSSLKLFSPKFLTSAFLEVKRNYEYDSRATNYVKKKTKKAEMREVRHDPPKPPQVKKSSQEIRYQRTAYDIELVI